MFVVTTVYKVDLSVWKHSSIIEDILEFNIYSAFS